MSPTISIIFILGPPGAGKSTLGSNLRRKFPSDTHMHHISVGDLLRSIKNVATHPKAELIAHKLAKQELLEGKILVPIILNKLEELASLELARKVVVLVDGFPRNLAQMREFEESSKPRLVLLLNCPKEVAKQRYLTRKAQGREADDEDLFEWRYAEYVLENEGIVREYRERGVLVDVDASFGVEEVVDDLCEVFKNDDRWIGSLDE